MANLLEINAKFKRVINSMFPKMCEAGGLGYAELIELLIQQGLARFSQRRSLETSR